jgi:hypothetical protein
VDFRKFGFSIAAIGAIILVVGAIMWNGAKGSYETSQRELAELVQEAYPSGSASAREVAELSERAGYAAMIEQDEKSKQNGFYILIAGLLVSVVGLAMVGSAKETKAIGV